ncbi:MAG: hypothetical protein ING90_02125 [Rhodocyclaceae bacterium]|nr:hypothetical protein [Rhodocyclaceae bacterium]
MRGSALKTTGHLCFLLVALASLALHGAPARAQDPTRALTIAIESLDLKSIEKALRAGASASAPAPNLTGYGQVLTPIELAINARPANLPLKEVDGRIAAVIDLLIKRGAKMTISEEPVLVVIWRGYELVASRMVDAGLDVTQRVGGYTPAELALLHGHSSLHDTLVRRGAPPVSAKVRVQLLLMHGVDRLDTEIVSAALAAGADIDGHDPSGQTALTYLLSMPLLRDGSDRGIDAVSFMTYLLFSAKADPRVPNRNKDLPLNMFIRLNSFSEKLLDLSATLVSLFLKRGASVSAIDASRSTALHMAAQRGNAPVIAVLLKAGADSMAKDIRGDTPIDLARNSGIRNLLREQGRETLR